MRSYLLVKYEIVATGFLISIKNPVFMIRKLDTFSSYASLKLCLIRSSHNRRHSTATSPHERLLIMAIIPISL